MIAKIIHFPRRRKRPPGGGRFRGSWGLLLLGVVLVALFLVGSFWVTSSPVRIAETTIGEWRSVPLERNITVRLNTQTKARIWSETPWLWRNRRTWHFEILYGEASCTLTGKHSYLQAHVNGATIREFGTEFSVRRFDDHLAKITVQRGVVQVSAKYIPNTLVRENQVLTLHEGSFPDAVISEYTAEEIVRQLAWRQGMLEYRNESLAAISEEFSRYSQTRIEPDPSLANMPIGGAFSAIDPETFAKAVAKLHPDIRVEPDNSDPSHPLLRLRSVSPVCQHNRSHRSQSPPCHS